jgi:hypothetical protein
MMFVVLEFVGNNYLSILYENEIEMVLTVEVQDQQVYLH